MDNATTATKNAMETVTIGQTVRARSGRVWVEVTVLSIGTDYGGTPVATINLPEYFRAKGGGYTMPTRNVSISALRPVKS